MVGSLFVSLPFNKNDGRNCGHWVAYPGDSKETLPFPGESELARNARHPSIPKAFKLVPETCALDWIRCGGNLSGSPI